MRVFISSTCYDLIDLRAELAAFFQEAGVTPVLSDEMLSDFRVEQDCNSIETCLSNVRNSTHFIIILSQRYGPKLNKAGYPAISATHLEYQEAVKHSRSIHMYVRDRLDAEHAIWRKNRDRQINYTWCKNSEDHSIFELLEEHENLSPEQKRNNWRWTFRNSMELKQGLKKEFREILLRESVRKMSEIGTIPLLEMTAQFTGASPAGLFFEVVCRNFGTTSVISPIFQILTKPNPNNYNFGSLAASERSTMQIQWNYQSQALTHFPTRLFYSTPEGHQFEELGVLDTRTDNRGWPNYVSYNLKSRRYVGTVPEYFVMGGEPAL